MAPTGGQLLEGGKLGSSGEGSGVFPALPSGASPLPTVCVTLSPPPEGGGMRPVSALLSGTGLNPSPQ